MSRLWKGMVLAPWLTLAWTSNALAQSNPAAGVGERFKDAVISIAVPVFIGMCICMALTFLGLRQHAKLVIWSAVAFGVSLFVLNPDAMMEWMRRLGGYFLGA